MLAYLDLPSGLSGDMFLGCLVDAGWDVERLRSVVRRLGIPGDEWSIEAAPVLKARVRATLVGVSVAEGRVRRRWVDVRQLIEGCDLPGLVKERVVAVFARLAEAEGKVHGVSPDQVHFHEVGAVDAIIDIVGVVAGLNEMGIERVYASAVPLGSGWVNTEHGLLPLPAPATLELLAAAGAPTKPALGPGEWVTPTGAALLAELATFEQPGLAMDKVGVGAGRKDCPWPNVARMWLGEAAGAEAQGGGAAGRGQLVRLVQLETNIDDMNPQLYQAVVDRLIRDGALDVWLTPIQMKKNRPAVLLSALCPESLEEALCEVILRETTTLGVRVHALRRRREADREVMEVETPFGKVRVKVKRLGAAPVGATPEYEDCRARAEAADVPVKAVHDAASEAALALMNSLRMNSLRTSLLPKIGRSNSNGAV